MSQLSVNCRISNYFIPTKTSKTAIYFCHFLGDFLVKNSLYSELYFVNYLRRG